MLITTEFYAGTLKSVSEPINQSVSQSVSQSMCLSVCLFIYLLIYLFIYLFNNFMYFTFLYLSKNATSMAKNAT